MKNTKNNDEKRALNFLKDCAIDYELFEHESVWTVSDVENLGLDFNALGLKTLVLRDRKAERFYLVVLNEKKRLDIKALQDRFNEKKLIFASEENLIDLFRVLPGSLSPMALINYKKNNSLKIVLDEDLLSAEYIAMHPNNNAFTVRVSSENFQKFMDRLKLDYKYLPL